MVSAVGSTGAGSIGKDSEQLAEKAEVVEETEELIYYMENEDDEDLGHQVEIEEEVIVKEIVETVEEV